MPQYMISKTIREKKSISNFYPKIGTSVVIVFCFGLNTIEKRNIK